MLGFLSFIIALTVLSAAVGLIIISIRQSSGSIIAALIGVPKESANIIVLPRRAVRQLRPVTAAYAPMRAAA